MASAEKVQEVISSFKCKKDCDIVKFLNERAIEFEELSKSRTFFLFDEGKLENNEFVLLAYFTVALQMLKVERLNLSNRKIKELDGLSAKRNGAIITEIPVFLIGQLAKNDTSSNFDGKIVLDHAMSAIKIAQEKIGGRVVLVECRNIEKVIKFYTDNCFHIIREDEDKLMQLIQMI